ncbi:MAG: HEAT repeat domain-containing protein, partial [Verrucomicrobiota bacterium]
DKFVADTFAQGAAQFGAGILWEGEAPAEPLGNDSARREARPPTCNDTEYRLSQMGQGFGGIQGIGLLLDASGNDSYTAGGKSACGWLPGHYFSLSQGFGYGMRPFAGGGIGILCDLKGDDHYKADVYGQGASYWYAVGLLLDAEGNDTYEAHQYCQGAGIHLSTGALVDWAGNDTYTAGHICQGAAHDYSVGVLIDRAGNDQYVGDTTAQGAAINNSFAMLIDHAGDDTYTGTDPKQSQAAGHDGDKREYGSIALLLDLGGKDNYSQGQSNNAAWLKPLYGAGLDLENSSAGVSPVPFSLSQQNGRDARATRLYTLAPVDPHHPIEHLFRVATSDRPDAGKAWEELKQRAAEVLPYLITRSASPNVMVRVKIEELVDHLNTNAIPLLIAGIQSTKDDEIARLCCYFLARFNEKARAAIPAILPLLKRPVTRPVAFYTLGHLRAAEAFAPAMIAVDESRELVRLRATQALGKIGNKRAIPRLIHKLDDEMYDVRYAAEYGLVAFGQLAVGDLRRAYERATPRARPHLIEALAKLGDERAVSLAQQFYRSDEPIIRAAVLQALTDALKQARTKAPAAAK